MAQYQEKEFASLLKSQPLQGSYLLCGTEEYLIDRWRDKLLSFFGGDSGFNLQKLDGKNPDWDSVFDATQMLPVFATQKCVLLDGLEPTKLNASNMEKLTQIVQELPEETIFILIAKPPSFDVKTASAKKLIKLVDQKGTVALLNLRDRSSLTQFLQSQAKQQNCVLSTELARYLIERCENDMYSLQGELAKVCAYAGEGNLSKLQIDAVITPKTEAKIFDLSKAILGGNTRRAMEILDDLFYLRETPIAISSTLIMSYLDLYRARIAKDNAQSVDFILSKFPYKGKEFRIRNAFQTKISTTAARLSLALLDQCDRRLKSSSGNHRIILEQTVLQLIRVRNQ